MDGGNNTMSEDSVYFADMMRTLHQILTELQSINTKLDRLR